MAVLQVLAVIGLKIGRNSTDSFLRKISNFQDFVIENVASIKILKYSGEEKFAYPNKYFI